MRKHSVIYTLFTLLGSTNASDMYSSLTDNSPFEIKPTVQNMPTNRILQSTIQGTCRSSTLSPGDLVKANESILCYPQSDSPIYKFGIDSTNTLSYYVYDTLIWRAIPNANIQESTACIVFGNCEEPAMVFFRLQNGGSLVGYDGDTTKIWDSHEDVEENGEYAMGADAPPDAVGDKITGSTLIMTEEGVFIQSTEEEVTWRIVAPDWEAPSVSPVTVEPTRDPTAAPVTSKPTSLSPTLNPTSRPSTLVPTVEDVPNNFVGINGHVFEDEIDTSLVVGNLVVDLYDCPESGDPTWIVMTRTNETGHYILKDDDSSIDLTNLLASKNITKFRAVFGGLPSGYTFSPAVSGSDVNSLGETACWDLEENGRGSIVWSAGVLKANTSTSSPVNLPTSSAPTSQSPSKSPTLGPSAAATNEPAPSSGLVGGYAFFDANDDGLQSMEAVEPFMTNIDVELFACGSTAANFNDDTKLAADKTNAEGMYSFRNLTSGFYRVNVTTPEGYEFSQVWSGNRENGELTDPDADSTVDPDVGSTPCFRVIQGNTDLSWSFGLTSDDLSPVIQTPELQTNSPVTSPAVSSDANIAISGAVFLDSNKNGFYEEIEEEALSSVDVALFDCDGEIVFVSSTDENGMYGFENLEQGSYQVKFSPPAGYAFSSVWSGAVDDEGKLNSTDANSDVDPQTGLSPCREFIDSVFSLDAGMVVADDAVLTNQPTVASKGDNIPTSKPTNDPEGDGTPCSGSKCQEGMCRNVAGVCGSGLSFCNPQSVWTPDCPDEVVESPTLSPITVEPTDSIHPTVSRGPSQSPSVYAVSICNNDGTYGETTLNSEDGGQSVKEHGLSFTYSLLNESDESFEEAVARFEEELSLTLACTYFDDPCLDCSTRRKRRRLVVEGSSLVGLSSKPADEQNLSEACAFPNYKCRVMNGLMTSYFPVDTPLSKVISDTNQLLTIISEEMATNEWNGVTVSYNNEPPTESGLNDTDEDDNSNGGLSTGALVGIILASIAALVLIVYLAMYILRERREKEEQMQSRVIPYGEDMHGGFDGDDDSDDSDSSFSDDDDDESGVISGPSQISGGDYSFPTTMARANPSDVEDGDTSSSEDDSTSESEIDEDEEEYDLSENENGVDHLKTSASSDEAPPVYEQDDMGDYTREQSYPDQYHEQIADDEMNFAVNNQFHDPRQYGQARKGDDGSNGSGGSMGSMNSADPPGISFGDRDRGNGWLPPPQLHSTSDHVIQSGFFPPDDDSNDVYEHDELSRNSNVSRRSSRSNRSKNSNGSNRSNRSKGRSKSRERKQASYHSFYNDEDDEYIGDVEQGSSGPRGGHTDQDHVDYHQQTQQEMFGHEQNFNGQYYNDPQDVHNSTQPQQYEEYNDRDDTSAYSDSTRLMSNAHNPKPSHQPEKINEVYSEQSDEEDEESISNIFKSLSEIQTKLAKKGKTSSKGKGRKGSSAVGTSSGSMVEDVSVDGSQMSSLESRAAKNRRPSEGNWMEPVDEQLS